MTYSSFRLFRKFWLAHVIIKDAPNARPVARLFFVANDTLSRTEPTRMLILEFGDIVDILVNHNPQAIALGM